MAVRDLRAHAEGCSEVAGLDQRSFIASDSAEDMQRYGLIGRPPLLDGQRHRTTRRRLSVGLAARVPIDIRESGESRWVVCPLLDTLAVCGAFFEMRGAFCCAPRQSVTVSQAHRDWGKPVLDVIDATDLQDRLENV